MDALCFALASIASSIAWATSPQFIGLVKEKMFGDALVKARLLENAV